ncbi:trans-resveratrol di-O-methyltransferase-like [Iris pallida]|uniref:Trans-resveratrol di-O-methyltransferase-like n=1 Tax=Iris pallida TaxID=29817 RepID=A0AAX6FRX0_IRIPA|nr:trans-resveratrol di-O-methyltransferase-like [Iris pallida]KAJ6824946.1 trans-resveratrol di-O-methyltransferase-like [Iris pallida]
MALKGATKEETEELLQAHSTIMHEVYVHAGSMALKCAVELDIPGIISSRGGPVTHSDLVAELSIPEPNSSTVRRIMRILVHKGYFIHDKTLDTYSLTPLSRMLVYDNPISLASYVMGLLDTNLATPWHNLSTFCRLDHKKGFTVYEMEYGKSLWKLSKENSEFTVLFNETMDGDGRVTMKALLEECTENFEGLKTLVDVGGGDGTSAIAITKAFPHIKCIVYDLPHVVTNVPQGSPVEVVGGSMFDHIPQADVVFMKLIMHDWDDEDCVKVLKLCKEAIPSREDGGKVILVEIVRGFSNLDLERETHIFFDLAMMVYMGGKEREEHEWKKIFTDAGFTDYKITPLGLRSLIEVFP